MEAPKFRIKKVGEEYPTDIEPLEDQTEENLATLKSINEATNTEAPVIPAVVENKCINCAAVLEKNTVICIACGTNQASGKGLKTKSLKQKKKKFKQKTIKAKKPMDSWLITLIFFGIVAYPFYHLFKDVIEEKRSLKNTYPYCVSNLKSFHKSTKRHRSYLCNEGADKNFDIYKPVTKSDLQSPNFVKAYCNDHKHGVNIRGEVVEVSSPIGKKVKVPNKFRRTKADGESISLGLNLIMWAIILNIAARFSFCYYAIKDSMATFLCCLLIPFYSILFWLRNREQVGPSFTCAIISTIMLFIGFATISSYVL